ncbi:MAG: MBL fold metallo-hydrolase RNA specificity domain-containing protein [bacterium]|nr:MBL fold metallo-hydrolase RNA specificity domain-containing protein [bacterium]
MQITSLGPKRQIGGNCFLVQFKNGSKYFLDCGVGLLKTEELGGESFWNIYSYPKQLLTDFDFYPVEPSQQTIDKFNLTNSSATLLISHPHTDHYMGFPSIAKYVKDIIAPKSVIDYFIPKILNELTPEGEKEKEYGFKFNTIKDVLSKAKALEFKDTSTKINNVQTIQIDHSTIPSFMYLIQEGDERLVYTGDFRGQIFSPDKGQLPTTKAINILKKWIEKTDVLICEGTNLEPAPTALTNEEACKLINKNLKEIKGGLGIIIRSGDYSLVMRLFEMIKKYDTTRQFFIVKNYYDWVVGKETREHLDKEVIPQELTKLLQELFQSGKIRYATREKDVNKAISPVLISTTYQNEMSEFNKIIRYSFDKVFSKCLVMVSLSMSYSEHWTQRAERLYELLKLRKILLEPYYTSGHATVSELIDLIKALKPKTVIPAHSFNPEYFHTLMREAGLEHKRAVIPCQGEIVNIRLICGI